MSFYSQVRVFFADLTYTIIIALFSSLAFESPIVVFEKVFFGSNERASAPPAASKSEEDLANKDSEKGDAENVAFTSVDIASELPSGSHENKAFVEK